MTDTTTRTIYRAGYGDRSPVGGAVVLGIILLVIIVALLAFFGGWFNTHRQDDRADLSVAGNVYREVYGPRPADILASLPAPASVVAYRPAVEVPPAGPVVSVPSGGVARPDGPGRCRMGAPRQGEIGYIWSDRNCHHLPPGYAGG